MKRYDITIFVLLTILLVIELTIFSYLKQGQWWNIPLVSFACFYSGWLTAYNDKSNKL